MAFEDPLVTVVTVTYNAAETIARTIDSVQQQTFKSFEHIIVDGKSTDNTMSIVDSYGDVITQKVSEPDNGIYDAMNKGLRMARGEWIIFLNAGDYFHSDKVLAEVKRLMLDGNDIIYSDVICDYGRFKKTRIAPDAAGFDSALKKGMAVCHNAVFFRVSLHKNTPYNPLYSIAADFDVLLEMLETGARVVKHPLPVSTIETGDGISYKRQVKTLLQHRRVLKAHPHTPWQILHSTVAIAFAVLRAAIKKVLPVPLTELIIRLKK